VALSVLVLAALGGGGWWWVHANRTSVPAWRRKIASAATSQVGYRTDPPDTYCNEYSAFWGSGAADCGNHNLDEEWCADFAAWAWNQAGVDFEYGQAAGQIDSAAISFYSWGMAHGTWHSVGSGYRPSPGDVAVYGLDLADDTVAHVAVVTSYHDGDRGPDVVNGDGDRTGFSVVETGKDQYDADTTGSNSAPLAGYVAPLPPTNQDG
jgi:CHAP domain